MFELVDPSAEKVVDYFELADSGLEGCIELKKTIVGLWWFGMAVVRGGRRTRGRRAQIERWHGGGGLKGVVGQGDTVEQVLGCNV